MVGSGSSYVDPGNVKRFDVVLKLNYRINSSIYGSLISGTLESMHDDKDNSNYFEPISILGLNKDPNYEYTLVEKANGSDCLSGKGGGDSLSLSKWFLGVIVVVSIATPLVGVLGLCQIRCIIKEISVSKEERCRCYWVFQTLVIEVVSFLLTLM